MNAQLALPLDLSQGEHGSYAIKDRTIVFKAETSQDEWSGIVSQLADLNAHTASAHVRIMFLLGDALNFGERTYGEEAFQAIDATRKHLMLSMKTVENAAWIAAKVQPENRHELLSMAHHESVARLDASQQRELLDEAENEGLPVKALKARVREISPSRPRAIKPKKKRKDEAGVTQEQAVEACAVLAEFAIPYLGKKASEITPLMRKAFDEHIAAVHNFARRFVRKN